MGDEVLEATLLRMSGDTMVTDFRRQIHQDFSPTLNHVSAAQLKIFSGETESWDENQKLKPDAVIPAHCGTTAAEAIFVTCPAPRLASETGACAIPIS